MTNWGFVSCIRTTGRWTRTKRWGVTRRFRCIAAGGAFWSITLSPGVGRPGRAGRDGIAVLAGGVPRLGSRTGQRRDRRPATAGYDFNFFYLDFTNTAVIRAFRTPRATCLLLCQAEDREFECWAAVFRAITTSLLPSLDDAWPAPVFASGLQDLQGRGCSGRPASSKLEGAADANGFDGLRSNLPANLDRCHRVGTPTALRGLPLMFDPVWPRARPSHAAAGPKTSAFST